MGIYDNEKKKKKKKDLSNFFKSKTHSFSITNCKTKIPITYD